MDFFLKAGEEFGIKNSTSKAILKIFREEGRIKKKKTRNKQELPNSLQKEEEKTENFQVFMPQIKQESQNSSHIPIKLENQGKLLKFSSFSF